jgi:hypothetical protein
MLYRFVDHPDQRKFRKTALSLRIASPDNDVSRPTQSSVKHEVPKKRGMVAEMPGYARIDVVKGTLYWQFIDAQGGLQRLDRREAANYFLDIKLPDYDE